VHNLQSTKGASESIHQPLADFANEMWCTPEGAYVAGVKLGCRSPLADHICVRTKLKDIYVGVRGTFCPITVDRGFVSQVPVDGECPESWGNLA
jgi:hypothetical protein